MMKKWVPMVSACTIAALAVSLAGCGPGQEEGTEAYAPGGTAPAQNRLQIEASFYPMYEFASRVAGDLADVHLLIPAGVEPHDWEPTPKDIAYIQQADMLVYNGAGMEGWVEQVLAGVDRHNLSVVEASKGLELMERSEDDEEQEAGHEPHNESEGHEEAHSHEHDHEHVHGELDPHVWLSPELAIQEVRRIEKALSEKAPLYQEAFAKNADAYVAELKQLDADFRHALGNAKRKDFITQHAAFGFLAKSYGLTQIPIAGLSPEQEPSAAAMSEVIDFAKEHQVQTIFFETLVSSQVADTIASELGAATAVLNPLEGLSEEDQANHLDYIAVMRLNLQALKKALNE